MLLIFVRGIEYPMDSTNFDHYENTTKIMESNKNIISFYYNDENNVNLSYIINHENRAKQKCKLFGLNFQNQNFFNEFITKIQNLRLNTNDTQLFLIILNHCLDAYTNKKKNKNKNKNTEVSYDESDKLIIHTGSNNNCLRVNPKCKIIDDDEEIVSYSYN